MKHILLAMSFLIGVYAGENLFEPLPLPAKELTPKAQLGKLLFNDPILSKDNTISCASCHPLLNYGVDSLPKSIGVGNALGKRNTPSVWNAKYNFVQFWDGRAKDLEGQALSSITNPLEMGEKIESVLSKLNKIASYRQSFKHLYPDGLTEKNLADAIAKFGETLISSNSKFDRFLQGDKDAMNDLEIEGLRLFKAKGCIACHNGINIGGTLYHKIGIFEDFTAIKDPDLGRYIISNKTYDKYAFKVPSLRNVAKTAPYFHDGSVATLREAVQTMARLQLGRELNKDDVEKIVIFLKTLTGEVYE